MRISVIIPAYNAAPTIGRALDAVASQLAAGDELIVVDDGSEDGTPDRARRQDVRLIERPHNEGVGFARNHGAAAATGDILLYTDADAELRPDVVEGIRQRMTDHPEISAWVGLYASNCLDAGVVSRFKNLWIRQSYLAAAPDVDFLFGCLCALRRSTFDEMGGFRTVFQRNTGGVDIELGYRMAQAGHPIRLDPALQVEHWRSFTLWGLVHNDFRRASGYTRLGISQRAAVAARPSIANISPRYIYGTAMVGGMLATLAGSLVWGALSWVALLLFATHTALNGSLYAYFFQEDAVVGLLSPLLLIASQLGAGFGVVAGALTYVLKGPPVP